VREGRWPHTPARTALFALLGGAAMALAACSSGSNGVASGASAPAHAPRALCQQLDGILSDGPDPGADPVGYALSQILPLRGVHSADASVMTALRQLVAADQALVRSNGDDHAATTAIGHADAALDRACPGVAP